MITFFVFYVLPLPLCFILERYGLAERVTDYEVIYPALAKWVRKGEPEDPYAEDAASSPGRAGR